MKKLIISILIFAILSFSITGILIYIKNNNEISNNEKNDIPTENKEKTLDLYGTFNENDLLIEKVIKSFDGEDSIEIPQISGLKDKQIENKVNADIEKRVNDKIKEIKGNGGEEIDTTRYSIYYRGFSNVISFNFTIRYVNNDNRNYEDLFFNYELVNGERLKFEDLFTSNADIINIIRRAYYREISSNVSYWFENEGDIYFDKEKNTWFGLREIYDENTYQYIEEYQEYVPNLSEYDINKKIKEFENSKDEFYFTPSRLIFGGASIEFKDIADDVVIYDKYLTEESLFENDNIGQKNLFTCATVNEYGYNDILQLHQEYSLAEENLFYEIYVSGMYATEIEKLPKEFIDEIYERIMEYSKDILEEYKELAKKNPDKFYTAYINSYISYDGIEAISNLLDVNTYSMIVDLDISYKEELIKELRECYRYYNLQFYNYSGMDYALGYGCDIFQENNINYYALREEKIEKVYDVNTLEEVTLPSDSNENI